MDDSEFILLYADCLTVTHNYMREAQKTFVMLARCARLPLTFDERLALLGQEMLERDAFQKYMNAKRILHHAALLGFAGLSTN